MTVKNQLINDLLKYPTIHKNKWACYHQWFAVDGNMLEWKDGELVGEDTVPLTDINLAIDMIFSKNIEVECEEIRDYSADLFDCGSDELIAMDIMVDKLKTIVSKNLALKNKIKLIINLNTRMEDMSQSDEFYGLTKDSLLCNLPETNIKDDWKVACQEFYDWIGENINVMNESTKELFYSIKTSWLNKKVLG